MRSLKCRHSLCQRSIAQRGAERRWGHTATAEAPDLDSPRRSTTSMLQNLPLRARSDYAGNGGSNALPDTTQGPPAGSDSDPSFNPTVAFGSYANSGTGIFYPGSQLAVKKIPDGLSKTYLFGEKACNRNTTIPRLCHRPNEIGVTIKACIKGIIMTPFAGQGCHRHHLRLPTAPFGSLLRMKITTTAIALRIAPGEFRISAVRIRAVVFSSCAIVRCKRSLSPSILRSTGSSLIVKMVSRSIFHRELKRNVFSSEYSSGCHLLRSGQRAAVMYAATQQGLGYKGTPQIPGTTWCVHDGDRPQPRVVEPGSTFSQGSAAGGCEGAIRR